MRRQLLLLAALAVSLAAAALTEAQDTRFYTPPIASVPRVKVAPKSDGILEPSEWANAAPLSPFVLLGGAAQPTRPTTIWVMYDDHNLYLGAILRDPAPGTLKATATERDGPVWEDDSLELFFDTDDQRKSYIHLAVNPKEIQYDAYMQDKSADYRWKARTATLADGWSVEFELPFANDFPPAPGVQWGFSAARHSAAAGELSSWDRKLKGFHELGNFGTLVFSDRPLSLEILGLGNLWLGANTAQVAVRNNAEEATPCKVNVRVLGRDRRGSFFGSTKVLAPGSGRELTSLPYSVYQDGFATVTLAVSDGTGKTVWRSSPYGVTTPEVAPQISAIEKTLGAATRSWMALPDSEGKKSLQADLNALCVQWRYLVKQYRERERLDRTELENLVQFADKLRSEAEMLQKQIQTAKTTNRPEARFGTAAVSSLQHVFPEQFGFEGEGALELAACRNTWEAAQLVVLPFC